MPDQEDYYPEFDLDKSEQKSHMWHMTTPPPEVIKFDVKKWMLENSAALPAFITAHLMEPTPDLMEPTPEELEEIEEEEFF